MSNNREDDDLQVWIRPKKELKESELPEYNEWLEKYLIEVCKGLTLHVYMIDKQIAKYRVGLRLVQPHGSGRIDLRYWLGDLPGRHPHPLIWEGLARGRQLPLRKGQKKSQNLSLTQRTSKKYTYTAKKIAMTGLIRRMKRTGKFGETAAQVGDILKEVERLLTMRATIVESVRRFRISVTKAVSAHNHAMTLMDAEVDRLMPSWVAQAEARHDELSERRRDHIILLDEGGKRLTKKGFQFGTMPTKSSD